MAPGIDRVFSALFAGPVRTRPDTPLESTFFRSAHHAGVRTYCRSDRAPFSTGAAGLFADPLGRMAQTRLRRLVALCFLGGHPRAAFPADERLFAAAGRRSPLADRILRRLLYCLRARTLYRGSHFPPGRGVAIGFRA